MKNLILLLSIIVLVSCTNNSKEITYIDENISGDTRILLKNNMVISLPYRYAKSLKYEVGQIYKEPTKIMPDTLVMRNVNILIQSNLKGETVYVGVYESQKDSYGFIRNHFFTLDSITSIGSRIWCKKNIVNYHKSGYSYIPLKEQPKKFIPH